MMVGQPNGWGWNDPAAIPPPGLFTQTRAGVPVTPHTALQVGVVHRALEVIVNSILSMGDPQAFRLAADRDRRPYRQFLWPQPSVLTQTWGGGWQTEGMTKTVISLALFGEFFWYVLERDKLGYPSALEVLAPMFLRVNRDRDTGLDVYEYGQGPDRQTLDPDDVIHVKGLTMPGARRGLSTMVYEAPSFALALAAMEYGSRWFSQGAAPSYLLTTEAKLGSDEVRRIAETFMVEHSGLQAAHLPLVLDSGLKAEKISSTPDEAQFLNTLEWARQEIGAYFGVPPHLLGSPGEHGGVWGKGIEEANFSLIDFTLSGYTTRLNEAFSSLLPRGQRAALNDRVLQRANAVDRAREVKEIRLGTVMTPNEVRRDYYDLPPIDGGDVLDAPLASNISMATNIHQDPEGIGPDDAHDAKEMML